MFGRELRQARDLTQEDLEGLTGLKRSYISDMERGTRNPTLKAVERLAIALDVGPAELTRLPEAAELTEKSPLKKG